MEKQEIIELMREFQRSGLSRMKLADGPFMLELEKAAPAAPAAMPTAASVSAPAEAAPAAQETLPTVNAPLVGTFFRAPGPDAEPYVRPGERVAKGQTVGLIEAMKTMSEIPAPCDLVVEEMLAENGSLVSFGAPLLRYRHV